MNSTRNLLHGCKMFRKMSWLRYVQLYNDGKLPISFHLRKTRIENMRGKIQYEKDQDLLRSLL